MSAVAVAVPRVGVVGFVQVPVQFILTGISCEACITYLTDEPHRHPAPDSGVKPLWKIVGLLKRESTLWIRSFISERRFGAKIQFVHTFSVPSIQNLSDFYRKVVCSRRRN